MAEHDNALAELDLKTVQARNYPYLNLDDGLRLHLQPFTANGTTPVARNARD